MSRLLILCEYSTLLGGERSMLATLPAVSAAGFDVTVAAPSCGSLADRLSETGIPHVAWQTRDAADRRLPLEELRANVADIVRRVGPDLLHANSLSTARISGPVAVEDGVRSIGHLRDIVRLSGQAIDNLNQHHRLLAVSRATRDFHVAQGIAADKCVVLNNGVDLNDFRPRPASGYLHRELGFPPGIRLIGVIGQLGLRKGTDVALGAARQIADTAPDVHWLIVGERTSNKDESLDFEARLHADAIEPPLGGRVHFLGGRTDVPKLLNECVLLVHAARQEPLGRVLIEAAASGVAVVATDVGGTRDIFPSESNGALLVAPDDRLKLAAAVKSLLSDEKRRRQVAAGARRRAESAFDIRTAAARLIEHYERAIG